MVFLKNAIFDEQNRMMNEHYQKGLEYCKGGKFEEGISEFNKSILLNPTQVEAFYNRGMAKFRLEKYLAAIQDFDEALKLSPKNADIISQRGVAKHLMGNSAQAMKDMNIAQELEPSNPYRYTSRAFIRAKMGDMFGAVDDYKIALELDPEDSVAWNNLGLLEEGMGYKQSAKERFVKADKLSGNGEVYEKPDLGRILKDAKEQEMQKINISQPVSEKEDSKIEQLNHERDDQNTADQPKLSGKQYFEVMKQVFTSKAVFKEFIDFVKNKFVK